KAAPSARPMTKTIAARAAIAAATALRRDGTKTSGEAVSRRNGPRASRPPSRIMARLRRRSLRSKTKRRSRRKTPRGRPRATGRQFGAEVTETPQKKAKKPPAEEAEPIPPEVAPASSEYPETVESPALLEAEAETGDADTGTGAPAPGQAPSVEETHEAGEAAAELATDLAEEEIAAPETAPNGDHTYGDGDHDEAAEENVQ